MATVADIKAQLIELKNVLADERQEALDVLSGLQAQIQELKNAESNGQTPSQEDLDQISAGLAVAIENAEAVIEQAKAEPPVVVEADEQVQELPSDIPAVEPAPAPAPAPAARAVAPTEPAEPALITPHKATDSDPVAPA